MSLVEGARCCRWSVQGPCGSRPPCGSGPACEAASASIESPSRLDLVAASGDVRTKGRKSRLESVLSSGWLVDVRHEGPRDSGPSALPTATKARSMRGTASCGAVPAMASSITEPAVERARGEAPADDPAHRPQPGSRRSTARSPRVPRCEDRPAGRSRRDGVGGRPVGQRQVDGAQRHHGHRPSDRRRHRRRATPRADERGTARRVA